MARELSQAEQAFLNKNTWMGPDSAYSQLSDGVEYLADGAKTIYNEYLKPDFYKRHLEADPRIQQKLRDLGYQGDTQADLWSGKTSDIDYAKGHISAANFVNEAERSGVPHGMAKGLGYIGGSIYQPLSWAVNNLTGAPESLGEMAADWSANMAGISADSPGYQTDDELIAKYPNRNHQAYLNDRLNTVKSRYPIFDGGAGTRIEYKNPKFPARGGAAETYPPNEHDAEGNLVNDSDQWAIGIDNLDDPRTKGNLDNLILGELLHTIKGQDYYVGREWDRMAKNVMDMRDPEQLKLDDTAYDKTIAEHYGGDPSRYSKDQWESAHRRDAYVRSVLAPDNNAERWTNAEQEGYIKNHMAPFLHDPTIRMLGGIFKEGIQPFASNFMQKFDPEVSMGENPSFLSEVGGERTLTGIQRDIVKEYQMNQTQTAKDKRGLSRELLAF